jgi:hypothetical protein
MKNILRTPRHPDDEKFIKHHLGHSITEIEIGHGTRLFRIGNEEYDNLSEAAGCIITSINDSIRNLAYRKVDRTSATTTRSRDEVRKLIERTVTEIEVDFIKKLREVFLPDGPFKTVDLRLDEYSQEENERKARADLRDRFIKASGDEFHFLLLIKHRPEILNQALNSTEAILSEAILSVPEYVDPDDYRRSEAALIADYRESLEKQLIEARKLAKK